MHDTSLTKVAIGYLLIAGVCIWRLGPLAMVSGEAVGGAMLPGKVDEKLGGGQSYDKSSRDGGPTNQLEISYEESLGFFVSEKTDGTRTVRPTFSSDSPSVGTSQRAASYSPRMFYPNHQVNAPNLSSFASSSPSKPYFEYSTIYVHDNNLMSAIQTSASTVRAALSLANIELGPVDLVAPPLSTSVSPGLHIFIMRAKEVTLTVGGVSKVLHTQEGYVDALLKAAKLSLGPLDRVEPSPEQVLANGMTVTIVRVTEAVEVQEESINFAAVRRPNAELEVGEEKTVQTGTAGRARRLVRQRLENDEVVSVTVEKEDRIEPKNTIIEYGTKVVARQMETADGLIQYGQKVRVYATWYTAGSSGKPMGHPSYGITATGMKAGRGVVAVDPRFIPLYTKMYIPGYGMAVAGDTGGGVKGAMIDLGFEDGERHNWRSGYIDIYLLNH